jgi:HK97 family phage portal protein
MTLIDYLSARIRRSGPNPAMTKARLEYWRQRSGANISEAEALSLSTYYASKTLIASTIASLPLHVLRDDANGTPRRLRGADARDTKYLSASPNPEQTRMTLFERVIGDEVSKEGYFFVVKDGAGGIEELWHIERSRLQAGRTSDGTKVYLLDGDAAMIDYSAGGEIVHVPNWGTNMSGWDIVEGASQALSLGLSAEEYAAKALEYGAVPPGLIITDEALKPGDAEQIRDEWTRLRRGTNSLKIAVLSKAKFEQLNPDLERLQMAEVRKFQAGDIATLLGVPPHMVGLVDKSSSWGAGIAEQTAGFATFTLARHIARFEHAINKFLLVNELTDRYCKFDLGGLLRGTTLQRYQAYAIGYGRWLSVNDIRRDEDMEPVEGGESVFAQLNVVPLDQLGVFTAGDAAAAGDSPAN